MSFTTSKFLDSFKVGDNTFKFYSIPKLEQSRFSNISRLPYCIRIILESLLRNFNNKSITEEDIVQLINWLPNATRQREIPLKVARVLLQDFTGVPLGVDIAAMRSATDRLGFDPKKIEPLVPVDLVIDHSVQVDYSGSIQSYSKNLDIEFERNLARYKFLKWCQQSFNNFRVIPPGVGICHQVNLEYLAQVVIEQKDGLLFPDSLVGTDSHTTMINGLGIIGWGVGGIEAESAMLGQPTFILTPDVVGVNLTGNLVEGVTATDLVLTITEMLRNANVVGKFVEFHGKGASALSVPDRATISNMAPEYGATIGFFPIDDNTCEYLSATGRNNSHIEVIKKYYQLQNLYGMPQDGECNYSSLLHLDLSNIKPSVAGPKRPQDRIELVDIATKFNDLLKAPISEGGYAKTKDSGTEIKTQDGSDITLNHGSVVIAAITSCTNTSNPTVMICAGLLARKAVLRGLKVNPSIKVSLAPGSRAVTDYLEKSGLQSDLNSLGFHLVGYGCTTCIGNSGPLNPIIEKALVDNDIIGASVLSGNRNFEARVHQNVKANFLMSPPLVVAFAIAGRVDIDFGIEPIGVDQQGNNVYLKDIWPTLSEVKDILFSSTDPKSYQEIYSTITGIGTPWENIDQISSITYKWDSKSTYIQYPPYFDNFNLKPNPVKNVINARALAIFGDSVTTDHISPAGSIKTDSPAGKYLQSVGVSNKEFNSYGSRRGNHEVMIRGTFANVRIRNLMLTSGIEGGFTLLQPEGTQMSIFDASMEYHKRSTPLIIIAGKEYGTGSSRDWAAKGTALLGVRAVLAKSFERIHRSNLIGMGVLPLELPESSDLKFSGNEEFTIDCLEQQILPQQKIYVKVRDSNSNESIVETTSRLDTPIEVEYYLNGGIMPYVLRELLV
jgi:aconitate hydratase